MPRCKRPARRARRRRLPLRPARGPGPHRAGSRPGYATAATLEGIAEDWFARNFGISIFKAAGNDPEGEACPFTLNSICVGGTNLAHDMSCFSSWINPGGETRSDREEPDVTALAGEGAEGCFGGIGEVDVMDVGDPSRWTGNDGTSFASPAMGQLRRAAQGGVRRTAATSTRSWSA